MLVSEFVVILVHTTSEAIFAERVLKEAGFEVNLIPTPRHLSSDCGSAVRIQHSESDRCLRLLSDAGLTIDRTEPVDQ